MAWALGGAAGKLMKLRQIERCAQVEASHFLLLRYGDGGEKMQYASRP
jgi:hypothetical protein